MVNFDILSERYATKEINEIFSVQGKIKLERELWIEVMKAQKGLGVDIPEGVIEKYENAKEEIDLKLIEEIEKETKHDVKARIEAFNHLVGEQQIHKAMTSRDLTDNIEQIQIKKASKIIIGKSVAILRRMTYEAYNYYNVYLTARTHHQPAQLTTLGRRFSMWAEELLFHIKRFDDFMENYPLRGIKGPVGTQTDMSSLLGNSENVQKLEQLIATKFGFNETLLSTGQIYPRSLDYMLISNMVSVAMPYQSFANTIRLMAGEELVTEGFKEGQVGSSAMPHKMNTKNSERIDGLTKLLKMYSYGAAEIGGTQWEEGDVSDSVVRREVIPSAFYCSDGLCETTLNILDQMGIYPSMIEKQVEKYLPFLATTKILMMAVSAGIGREKAHEVIKKYAVEEALRLRESGGGENHFIEKLVEDELFKNYRITLENVQKVMVNKEMFIGNAKTQIKDVFLKTLPIVQKYLEWSLYKPNEIL